MSARAQLERVTAECADQSDDVTGLNSRVSEMEIQVAEQKKEEQQLLEKVSVKFQELWN